MPGLLLLPLTFRPGGKTLEPTVYAPPACACTSQLLPASMCRLDGEAWPLLFPMATVELCMKVGKCALRLETQAGRFRMAPHRQPCPFPCSPALSHTEQPSPREGETGLSLRFSPLDSGVVLPLPLPTDVWCKVQVRDRGRKVAMTLGCAVGKSKKQVFDALETRMLSQAIKIIGNGGNIKRNCRLKGPAGELSRSCWKKQ